jgi:hypothetical protein
MWRNNDIDLSGYMVGAKPGRKAVKINKKMFLIEIQLTGLIGLEVNEKVSNSNMNYAGCMDIWNAWDNIAEINSFLYCILNVYGLHMNKALATSRGMFPSSCIRGQESTLRAAHTTSLIIVVAGL